jgi:hypothetical protein
LMPAAVESLKPVCASAVKNTDSRRIITYIT